MEYDRVQVVCDAIREEDVLAKKYQETASVV